MMIEYNELYEICSSIILNPQMLAVHLSDNGLHENKDKLIEVLDCFGIAETFLTKKFPNFINNR